MPQKKQPRSLETAAGMLIQHLNKLGVAQQMNDKNTVEVIPGLFGCVSAACLKTEQVREIRYLLSEGRSTLKNSKQICKASGSQIIWLARGQIYKDVL